MANITGWWSEYIRQFATATTTTTTTTTTVCTSTSSYGFSANVSLELVSSAHTPTAVAQELLQFVSLTVEGFRPTVNMAEWFTRLQPLGEATNIVGCAEKLPASTKVVFSLFWNVIVSDLVLLGKVVVESKCCHSFVKFIDIVNKCLLYSSLTEDERKRLFHSLVTLFKSQVLCWSSVFEKAARTWFVTEGKLVYRLLLVECGRSYDDDEEESSGSSVPQISTLVVQLSDTLLRKFIVLLLQVCVTAKTYNSEDSDQLAGMVWLYSTTDNAA